MSATANTLAWSRRKWMGLITASFLAHLVLIGLLGERAKPGLANPAPFQARLAESLAPALAQQPDFDDPVLFALPSLRGFSAAGWLERPDLNHDFHEWAEEQRWMALPVDRLGRDFIQYVRSLTDRSAPPPEKAEPALALRTTEMPDDWLPKHSRVRLEGPLLARLSGPLPEAPAWQHQDILLPTVAELLVDEKGRVFSVAILAESGSLTADEQVAAMAGTLRFSPARSGASLVAGQFTVQWVTLPETNAPALAPGP
jgi:hypothetical protein